MTEVDEVGRGICRQQRNFERVYLHEFSGYADASMTRLVQNLIEISHPMYLMDYFVFKDFIQMRHNCIVKKMTIEICIDDFLTIQTICAKRG